MDAYAASNQGNTSPPVDKESSDAAKTDDKCKSTCKGATGFIDFYKTLDIERPKTWSPAFKNYMLAAVQNKITPEGTSEDKQCAEEAEARLMT